MEFKKATPLDAKGIAKIESISFPDPWSQRDIENLLCSNGAMCFCATADDKVLAYVIGRIIPPEGEIYRCAVSPEYRRHGIGYRLLDYSVKTSRGKGLESLFLEVRSKNTAARNLYTAYGFHEVGIRKNYYKDPTDDAVIMLKGDRQYF